jgi:hypothetical protein
MYSRSRRHLPSHDRLDIGHEINHEIFDGLRRRDYSDFVRRTTEANTGGAYSVPFDARPCLREMNREAQSRQVFRNPEARVAYMAPKQSPRYTPPLAHVDDRANDVWIKARRGSPRSPARHSCPQEDLWDKIMRGSSPGELAPRRVQAFNMQHQSVQTNPARTGAQDEVKAGSDLQFVQAQVDTCLCRAHCCIDIYQLKIDPSAALTCSFCAVVPR